MIKLHWNLVLVTTVVCWDFGKGLMIKRLTDDWPLLNCHGMNIDMILVADAATSSPSSEIDAHYTDQMQFFSKLIDVFSPTPETNLTRLRVTLMVSSADNSSTGTFIDYRIPFDAFIQKSDLKRAIENDKVKTSPISYPLTVAISIISNLYNNTSVAVREDAEQIMVIVVDGGRPFQITKMDSELLGIFNTTKVKIAFVLIGVESGINLQTVFPKNNYVKVQSSQSLTAMQSIPVNLCMACYPEWFISVNEEQEIGATRVSCYQIFRDDNDINWLDASEKCKGRSSNLASVESETERLFLTTALSENIQKYQNKRNETSEFVNVYIGLTRRKLSLGQRFLWVNDMPLIHTHWGEGQPSSGTIEGCAVWNFSTNAAIEDTEGGVERSFNVHPLKCDNRTYNNLSINVNYWSSVACGFKNGRVYLCETETKLLIRRTRLITISADSPNNKSVASAIARGELAFYNGNTSLMSVSALSIHEDVDVKYYSTFVNHKMDTIFNLASLRMYDCGDSVMTLLPYSLLCDFKSQCPNAIDESLCRFRECDSRLEVKCSSGQCVQESSWCDLYQDCLDGSDEVDCTECQHGRCPDGRCAPYHWFGDGEVDCGSYSSQGGIDAEMEAVHIKDINQCVFTCNRTQCVHEAMLNNGIVDCWGPEGPIDEAIGALKSSPCYSELDTPHQEYTNWAPKCVYIKDRYGEPLGCRDMKHLHDCNSFICPEGYLKCPNSYCIPTHYFQNQQFDCPRGEDEQDVSVNCPGYFICASSNICLHPGHVCDSQRHCPEGDDELNCNVTCRSGFMCLGGAITVNNYNLLIPLQSFTFVDSRTRYLDVSGVNISVVFPDFPKGHFYNLLHANLSRCSITRLDATPSSQNELRSMLWIDLSYNLIQSVSVTSIFRYMIGLQTLNLSHNTHLTYMHNDALNTYSIMSPIVQLDLSYTGLTDINAALFVPLSNLRILYLRNTPLSDFLGDIFPENFVLQQLDLRGIVVQHLYSGMFTNVLVEDSLYTDSFKLCCPQLHNKKTPANACKAPQDPFSSCSDLISEEILRILLWANGFLALLGNIFVIMYRLIAERKILKMAYGHFVTHLSFSDLLMGIYLTTIAVADTFYRGSYVWDERRWRSSDACKVAGFLSTMSNETSTILIALITLDRFLVIRYPFGQLRISGKFINICCILSWTVGFTVALVPLLPPFEHWTIYSSNGMCLGLPLTNRRQPGWQFSTAIFIFLNFFLFILIVIGQLAIYRTVSESRISKNSLTNINSRRAQDLAVAKHLSLIAITEFLCWFPIGVIGLLALDGYDIGIEAYAWLAVLVLPVNSALNPLLYTIPAVTKKLKQFKDYTSCYLSRNLK